MPRPRTYDTEFRLLVYALKRTNPGWGHAKITAELRKRSGRETPSDRTVSRFLQSISAGEESLAALRIPWRAWEDEDAEPRAVSETSLLLRLLPHDCPQEHPDRWSTKAGSTAIRMGEFAAPLAIAVQAQGL